MNVAVIFPDDQKAINGPVSVSIVTPWPHAACRALGRVDRQGETGFNGS